jgi:hypothetical protein
VGICKPSTQTSISWKFWPENRSDYDNFNMTQWGLETDTTRVDYTPYPKPPILATGVFSLGWNEAGSGGTVQFTPTQTNITVPVGTDPNNITFNFVGGGSFANEGICHMTPINFSCVVNGTTATVTYMAYWTSGAWAAGSKAVRWVVYA